ncbi:MAG TPA: hypothetical protein VLG12_08750 [Candidatus Saccharimonadales bacterium]|nr:hypothetical protein [Candidatus Saccharimonadales bacterium]
MKKYVVIFISILFSFFILVGQLSKVMAATCPPDTDTKTNADTNTNPPVCYSNSDPLSNTGLNTQGGTRTCGPVRCPGDNTSLYSAGHTCIVQTNGKCYAGTGASGFNATGCTQAGTTAITCPKPMTLTIKVQDEKGQPPLNNVTFMVTYADNPPGNTQGQQYPVTTDSSGIAIVSGKLYSGDHFIIVPNANPNYSFNPPQIGSTTNVGDQEMNTATSCGTTLENGVVRPPCLFTAKLKASVTIYPDNGNGNSSAFPTDPTVTNAEESIATSIKALVVITAVAYGINWILGLGGKSPIK